MSVLSYGHLNLSPARCASLPGCSGTRAARRYSATSGMCYGYAGDIINSLLMANRESAPRPDRRPDGYPCRHKPPAGIVGAVQNDVLPFGYHAEHYARSIPGALLTWFTGSERHFIYLEVCHDSRDAGGVPLCRDRPGVDRAAAHACLISIIAGFFDRHLR
ncbi:MAG: hypothetical protein WCB46_02685 [Methanoregula sp.]